MQKNITVEVLRNGTLLVDELTMHHGGYTIWRKYGCWGQFLSQGRDFSRSGVVKIRTAVVNHAENEENHSS